MAKSITEKEKQIIINLGAFGFDAKKSALVLGWSLADVEQAMADDSSSFSQLYAEGAAKAEYQLSMKLLELSLAGDMKAMDKRDEKMKANEKPSSQRKRGRRTSRNE